MVLSKAYKHYATVSRHFVRYAELGDATASNRYSLLVKAQLTLGARADGSLLAACVAAYDACAEVKRKRVTKGKGLREAGFEACQGASLHGVAQQQTCQIWCATMKGQAFDDSRPRCQVVYASLISCVQPQWLPPSAGRSESRCNPKPVAYAFDSSMTHALSNSPEGQHRPARQGVLSEPANGSGVRLFMVWTRVATKGLGAVQERRLTRECERRPQCVPFMSGGHNCVTLLSPN